MMTANKKNTMDRILGESRGSDGRWQPEIKILGARNAEHRQVMAALFTLAAEIELATPKSESWFVHVENAGTDRSRVYLELLEGSLAEANRAMEYLRKFV